MAAIKVGMMGEKKEIEQTGHMVGSLGVVGSVLFFWHRWQLQLVGEFSCKTS